MSSAPALWCPRRPRPCQIKLLSGAPPTAGSSAAKFFSSLRLRLLLMLMLQMLLLLLLLLRLLFVLVFLYPIFRFMPHIPYVSSPLCFL